MINKLKSIWRDNVWSKVIAEGIIFIIVLLVLKISGVLKFIITIINLYFLHPYTIIILFFLVFILSIINLILFIKLHGLTKHNSKRNLRKGLKWFKNTIKKEDDFMRYLFLFWFPANERINTINYPLSGFMSVSLEYNLEFSEALDNHVIFYERIGLHEHRIKINVDVYKYIRDSYFINFDSNSDDFKKTIQYFKTLDFASIFSKKKR